MSSPVVPSTGDASSVEQAYLGIDTLHLSPENTTEHENELGFQRNISVNPLHRFPPFASAQRTLEHQESLLGFSSSDCSQEGSCVSPSDTSQKEHSISPTDSSQQEHSVPFDSSQKVPYAGTERAAKSLILSNLYCEGIRFFTPKKVFVGKEIQALLNPPIEDRVLIKRYHYDLDSGELTIAFMASPVHDVICRCILNKYSNVRQHNKALKSSLQATFHEKTLMGSSLPQGSRKKTGRRKIPDGALTWGSCTWPILAVVFEVGFTESYDDLVYDAHHWLLSSPLQQVNTVVIIKIDEKKATRKSDASKDRIRSLVTRFGDNRARAWYDIEVERDVLDYVTAVKYIQEEVHLKDWVGDWRVFAEKWKLKDGTPQRCGNRVEIYPKGATQESLSIPFTEIIPAEEYVRVKDFGDVPLDFIVDMEECRDVMEWGIQRLALDRAVSHIRQDGRDDGDPDYDPDDYPDYVSV